MGPPQGDDIGIPTYLDVDKERCVPPPAANVWDPRSMACWYVGLYGVVTCISKFPNQEVACVIIL